MALTPTTPETPINPREEKKNAEEDVLLREVDEAVRKDQMSDFVANYGKPLVGAIVLGLTAFAGYLYWSDQREAAMEQASETLTSALDQVEAGNMETAQATLTPVASDDSGDHAAAAKAAAQLLQGGIAQQQGKDEEAATLFAQLAGDDEAPEILRDLATVREIAATYDARDPADVIARLKPLAVPGNPWFGSAGEMVAMAYLEQGKRKEAGILLSEIAKNEDVPESLRSRTRQLAGLLGVDAIEDVNEILEKISASEAAEAAAQSAQ